MPLYHNVKHRFFQLSIWHITEEEEELTEDLVLHPSDERQLRALHTPARRREFMALRQCLKEHYQGDNPAVHYRRSGKPYLTEPHHISFSHTRHYAAVISSRRLRVGIDLECVRPTMKRIEPKFARPSEQRALPQENRLSALTSLWSAKECAVKITGNRRLDFLKEIHVAPFSPRQPRRMRGLVYHRGQSLPLSFLSKPYPDFQLTMGWVQPH